MCAGMVVAEAVVGKRWRERPAWPAGFHAYVCVYTHVCMLTCMEPKCQC